MLRYPRDEHVAAGLLASLRQRVPELVVWRVGDPGMPDSAPAILRWCEDYDLVLVANSRRSLPVHLADHLASGRHLPGIFLLNPGMGMGEALEYLIPAAHMARPHEYRDRLLHLLSL